MRTVTLIVVHCSANQAGSAFRMADIDRYHRSLGWIGCGYHYVIPTDGTVEPGRPEEMCYIGGLSSKGKPTDTRTEAQRVALLRLLEELHQRYPKALIVGHRDLDPRKACPCFDVVSEYRDLNP